MDDEKMQATSRNRPLVALQLCCAALAVLLLSALTSRADNAANLTRAMELMRKHDWPGAQAAAGRPGTVARDVIEWHRLRAGIGEATEAAEFLKRRPDWPGLDWLRRKSEPGIASAGTDTVMAFFADTAPLTPQGTLAHANARIAKGQRGDGEAEVVLAWRTMSMGSAVHASYLKAHGKLLAPHHAARLDRMLWEGQLDSARRMLPLVDDGPRALAQARIALQTRAAGVDTLIAAIPEALREAPGLAYDRFVWRVRKKRRADAVTLLLERSGSAETLGEPEKWARFRADLARRLMRAGDPVRAYAVVADHHTTPEIGYTFSDLEWIAGYLALRKLNAPATALHHFERFDASVETPISKGRGGYWLGRTHEAMGNAEAAKAAYAMGGQHQTSFYGLLAAERAGLPFDPDLATPPTLPPWREAAFVDSSVLKAGLLLLAADEPVLAERFLTHLVEGLDDVAASQLGLMAVELERPHLAVMISKRAARRAQVLSGAYYPLHPVGRMELPMAPEMTLAIARRESEFDPVVVSGAGARGLMQVMPATAKAVASDLGILAGHETARLTREWRYNAKLGANYLAKLAGELGGNVVLMSAGYNAGPSRPLRWIEEMGDPRRSRPSGEADLVDWIEHIPFDETRNYVMRVTESLPVYRARLGKDPLPIPFSAELTGSTLRAFAP